MKALYLNKFWKFRWHSIKECSCNPAKIPAHNCNSFGFGFNFAREDSDLYLVKEFFQLDKNENVHLFPKQWQWQDLAAFIKLFPSKSEARKNNWKGEMPLGFSKKNIKRWQNVIYLYVPTTTQEIT